MGNPDTPTPKMQTAIETLFETRLTYLDRITDIDEDIKAHYGLIETINEKVKVLRSETVQLLHLITDTEAAIRILKETTQTQDTNENDTKSET